MKKAFTIIALVAALQLLLASATYAAPPGWDGPGRGGPGWGGSTYHKVMYGETLYSIGRLYNAHPNCIANANGLWNPNVIYAGEVLYVPANCGSYPWYGQHPHHPVNYPNNCWNNCNDNCWNNCDNDCGDNCGDAYYPRPEPRHNYGYDYTGYYYEWGRERYSYSCGYYNNCW